MSNTKIEEMVVAPLFPNPVAMFEYGKTLTKKEMDFILKLETLENLGNSRSKESYLLTDTKTLHKLYIFALNCTKHFFKEIYQPNDDVEIFITQSWCNYSSKKQYHHHHSHPNSFISGVFFIQAEENNDKIVFHKDPQHKQIKILSKQYHEFNSETWWLPAKTGRLILFDSSFHHSVPPVVSDKTRISLSFNTFLRGNIGSYLNLTELKTHNI